MTDHTFAGRTDPHLLSRPERLEGRIRALLPSLNPAAKRVVGVLLADQARAARRTMAELAELAGTSESSVVRTTRALGFSGYADLRLALAAEAARDAGEQPVTGDITRDDPLPDVIAKLAGEEMKAISDTAAQLDIGAVDTVIDLIIAARRITVHGSGASGLVAMDLHHKLQRIGYPSHVHLDIHSGLTSTALLSDTDVAIGISYTGETHDVVEPLRQATAAGAATVAITNHPRSALARACGHLLRPAGGETPFRPGALASRISQLLTVDCLFVGITQRSYDTTMRALSLTHDALQRRRTPSRTRHP
ncbi:MurR/RpiR family transcriptional regulator [Streptomyces sp. NPDC057694]|uniref:MurR/RpiR family transcriptional regulator n=1 Tax=Streptomyces sp. NPDC057694 TaxID=3346216 RepID=UPI0036989921